MALQAEAKTERGKWLALTAALLGWMFDGLEQGLFSQVGRPAFQDLLGPAEGEAEIARWLSIATAAMLVGMATGGVLFGWLGDRIGRVRAMSLSVLAYALFAGLAGLCQSAPQIALCRFFSSLGMGGEWSLGVALVMEIWPDRSRGLMAGLIGASANVGYLLLALFGMFIAQQPNAINLGLSSLGLSTKTVDFLTRNSAWRLLMMVGATPALLTFFFRLFVPESSKWEQEKGKGATSFWAARDLVGILVGIAAAAGILVLWTSDRVNMWLKVLGTLVALAVITAGYCYPMVRYLQRSVNDTTGDPGVWMPTVRRMLLGACLSGVPLVVTWSSVQWSSHWADKLTEDSLKQALASQEKAGGKMLEADKEALVGAKKVAKAHTQFFGALGAILGCLGGALLGDWLGRRITYSLLCATSLAAALLFFLGNDHYGNRFLFSQFLVGLFSASFYGWLPLYLPELFSTRIRATAQGFSYNFGRNLAVVGSLATGNLTAQLGGSYNHACAIMSLMYLVGLVVIWFAPETRGNPLPE